MIKPEISNFLSASKDMISLFHKIENKREGNSFGLDFHSQFLQVFKENWNSADDAKLKYDNLENIDLNKRIINSSGWLELVVRCINHLNKETNPYPLEPKEAEELANKLRVLEAAVYAIEKQKDNNRKIDL